MILIVLVMLVIVYGVPLALFGSATWLTARLIGRRTRTRIGWAVAALIPATVIASEEYARHLAREIARSAAETSPRIVATSYMVPNADPGSAARLAAEYPRLRFTEGIVEPRHHGDRSSYAWNRIRPGPVRFEGSRQVASADDCAPTELALRFGAYEAPEWRCTRWRPVARITAEFTFDRYFVSSPFGPYRAEEIRDALVRRSDGARFNIRSQVTVSGGLWWHLVELLGDATGVSGLGQGNMQGGYTASTLDEIGVRDGQRYELLGGL